MLGCSPNGLLQLIIKLMFYLFLRIFCWCITDSHSHFNKLGVESCLEEPINDRLHLQNCFLQNRAARIVAGTVRSNPAMVILKWPTLEERGRKSVFKLVKKCQQVHCPQYFKQYFKRNFKNSLIIHKHMSLSETSN